VHQRGAHTNFSRGGGGGAFIFSFCGAQKSKTFGVKKNLETIDFTDLGGAEPPNNPPSPP